MQSEMEAETCRGGRLAGSRLLFLSVLFFCICMGLGYPSLNRVDYNNPQGGLVDVQTYAKMVDGTLVPYPGDHMQYRVLVPDLARPVYRLTRNRLGSWDPVMFGLLVVDSLFVAATVTVLLTIVYRVLGSYPVALGSALLYLLNFAVPNLRLAGFVDAGEGFFLILTAWSLLEKRYWLLPLLGLIGATGKESFVPFLIVFTLSWWAVSRKMLRNSAGDAAWMIASWIAGVASLVVVQWKVDGAYRSPIGFAIELHQNDAYVSHFIRSFADRNLWYIFFWLLPLSLVRLRRLPLSWRMATGMTSLAAFAMDAYYGGQPGTIGRALFTVAGPLLSASVAVLLFGGWGGDDRTAMESVAKK